MPVSVVNSLLRPSRLLVATAVGGAGVLLMPHAASAHYPIIVGEPSCDAERITWTVSNSEATLDMTILETSLSVSGLASFIAGGGSASGTSSATPGESYTLYINAQWADGAVGSASATVHVPDDCLQTTTTTTTEPPTTTTTEPPTTTTTEPATTTTAPATTTTTDSPSPPAEVTTTTVALATTTTTAAATTTTTTAAGDPGPTTTAHPPATTPSNIKTDELPNTGASTMWFVSAGTGLVGSGALLTAAARRKRVA